MNYAGCFGFLFSFYEQYQATIALGNNWLLHQTLTLQSAEAALHYVVQFIVGGAGVDPQLTQCGAGIVQGFSRRTDC